MCKHDPLRPKRDPSFFEIIPSNERAFFSVHPFRWRAPSELTVKRRGKNDVIILASFLGKSRVIYLATTDEKTIRFKGMELSKSLDGAPAIVGVSAGFDGERVIYETIAKIVTEKADALSEAAFLSYVEDAAKRLGVIGDTEAERMLSEIFRALPISVATTEGAVTRIGTVVESVVSSPSAGSISSSTISIRDSISSSTKRFGAAASRLPEIRSGIASTFRLDDRAIANAMARHHAFWARNEYGQISTRLGRQASEIVQRGISQGLGRREIGAELTRTIQGGLDMTGYWRTVAANHIARARSYAMGASMRAAGIYYYRITAVLDEATTETCLMLNDKVLPVGDAMALQDRILADPNPEGMLWLSPFVVADGDRLVARYPDGSERLLAQVNSPGSGTGSRGDYAREAFGRDLIDACIGFPPYHHNCRTSVVSEAA